MGAADTLLSRKVGDRTGNAQDLIVAACRKAELFKGGAEHGRSRLVGCAVTRQLLGAQACIRMRRTLGGTGTRDIAGAEMMTAMGFTDTESGVIPILVTVVTLLVALSCSVFFVFDRGKHARKQ